MGKPHHEIHVRRDDAAAALVRAWLEAPELPLLPADVLDMRLLTHELVTNSVRHSTGDDIVVRVETLTDVVRVTVTDNGGQQEPRLLDVAPYDPSGRGLHWVGHLAREWGVRCGDCTCVWFELDRSDLKAA